MPSSIRLVRFVAVAIVVAGLAAGAAPVSAAMVVAVVPFAQPGSEKVQNLDDATGVLTAELTERGLTPKTLAPTDRLAVCAQTGATGIFVPTMRTERAVRQRNNVLAAVDYYATHVELRLSLVRCDGSLSWTGTAVGDKDYVDANVQAGFADGISQAIGRVLELFASRTPDTARPNATATPAPRLPKGPKIAIVPFTQLGMEPDPSLDFATEEARKRYAARGYEAIVTEPADHLIATKNAPAMCARYDASRLVMGTLRWEQTPKSDGVATHAEIMLSTVDCTGRVIATQDEIGDHLHHGADYRAGVSAAIEDAFAHWADQPLPAPKT